VSVRELNEAVRMFAGNVMAGIFGLHGRFGSAAAVLVLAGAALGSAFGQSGDIDDFDVAIVVDESGAIDVKETLRVRFVGQRNGIVRVIPIQNVTTGGDRRNLGFRLLSVTDDAGTRLEVNKTRRGAVMDLRIRVPGAVDAVRTVVIHYRISNAVRFFPDHDELYWNVTGEEWPFLIRAARARITLPASLVNLRANAFAGGQGTGERSVTILVNGLLHDGDATFEPASESPPPPGRAHVVEVEATRPLGLREGMTVVVGWNPGVVRRPSVWARAVAAWTAWFAGRSFLALAWATPVLAFAAMFWRWWTVGRDPRPGPLVVEYAPPDGLGPAEVGTLIDNRPDTRDLMAGLVDAAVKGVIRIRETKSKGWFSGAEYAFDLLVPESGWSMAGIPPSGSKILRGMFKTRSDGQPGPDGVISTCASGDLANSFYSHLRRIKKAIFDDLESRGFYRTRPDKIGLAYYGLAFACVPVVWVLSTLAFTWAGIRDETTILGAPPALALSTALIVAGFGAFMPARTVAGARARDQVRGFQEFLARVDAHRLESLPLTPALFEKFLPYAIALGVERRWAGAFIDICTEPPTWYAGSSLGDRFDTGGFTNRLGVMGASTAAVMAATPRSSGSSGFGGGSGSSWGGGGGGGGGFVGGGDGGGGGSIW
jgi:uncharacterized membrane protein YgcG